MRLLAIVVSWPSLFQAGAALARRRPRTRVTNERRRAKAGARASTGPGTQIARPAVESFVEKRRRLAEFAQTPPTRRLNKDTRWRRDTCRWPNATPPLRSARASSPFSVGRRPTGTEWASIAGEPSPGSEWRVRPPRSVLRPQQLETTQLH